jgi:hypothetical protein
MRGMTGISCVVDGQQLVFRCDADRHLIVVTDAWGAIQWVFGERGGGAGSFDTPLGLTLVRPEFRGERLPKDGMSSAWLAVADYGNRRVQIFELDGTWVATIGASDAGLVGPPCALRWSAPFLEIEGVEGNRTRVSLSATLLSARARIAAMPLPTRVRPTLGAWDHN